MKHFIFFVCLTFTLFSCSHLVQKNEDMTIKKDKTEESKEITTTFDSNGSIIQVKEVETVIKTKSKIQKEIEQIKKDSIKEYIQTIIFFAVGALVLVLFVKFKIWSFFV